MAKSKALKVTDEKPKRVKIKDFMSINWVMNNLSDDEITALDQTEFDGERFADFMEMCVDNGLDIKVTWDNYAHTYQVTLIGAWQGFPNESCGVSSRGNDIFDAFKVAWFKVTIIANWDLRSMVELKETRRKRG